MWAHDAKLTKLPSCRHRSPPLPSSNVECLHQIGISGKVSWWVYIWFLACAPALLRSAPVHSPVHSTEQHLPHDGMNRIQSTFLCIINAYYFHHRKAIIICFRSRTLHIPIQSHTWSFRRFVASHEHIIELSPTPPVMCLPRKMPAHIHDMPPFLVCARECVCACASSALLFVFGIFIFGHNERQFVLINVYLSPLIDF